MTARFPATPPEVPDIGEIGKAWLEHWWSLPRQGLVPLRADFDPSRVPRLLPYLEMHDLRQPGVSRLRLVGTRVAERYGRDPTGRDYLNFVAPERRAEALAGLTIPCRHPCGMRVEMTNTFEFGARMRIEAVGLPFRYDAAGGPMMLFTDVVVGEAPPSWTDPGRLVSYILHDRHFIDIGAGIPAAHVDRGREPA